MSKFTSLSAAVAIACVSAGLARADDSTPITRAQVIAEVHAARASGELYAMGAEDSGSFWMSQQPWRSTLTREQVRAELAAACADGACMAMTEGEVVPHYHAAAAVVTSPLTRAEVAAACAHGECMAVTEGEGVPRFHAAAAAAASPLTRAEVSAEAQRALHSRLATPAGLYAGPSLGSGHDAGDLQTSLAGLRANAFRPRQPCRPVPAPARCRRSGPLPGTACRAPA